ncbi:MAG: phage baseplate assembly protein V [Desulfovibrionaceae bacterium]
MSLDALLFRLAELERKLPNVVRVGTVEAADYPAARVRVRTGDIVTGWLPWLTVRAGMDRSWWAPEVGEQTVVLSPSGELAQGVVLFGLYRDAHPAIADVPTIHRVEYADGAFIEYDREQHILSAYVPGDIVAVADGNVAVTAGGDAGVFITGDLDASVGGDVTVAAQGAVAISSPSKISLAAPVIEIDGAIQHGGGANGGGASITGPLTQTGGGITTDGDVVAGGISLEHHTHPAVASGEPA